MRPTLLGSLLDAARHNASRNGPDVAIFESGTVYRAARGRGRGAEEHHALGVAADAARWRRRSWRGTAPEADFFAAKALLGSAARPLPPGLVACSRASWPFLHPGRSAAVCCASGGAASARLRSASCTRWSRARGTCSARRRSRSISASSRPPRRRCSSLPRLRRVPAVLRQDLAVTLPDAVPAAELLERVRAAGRARRSSRRGCSTCTRGEQVGEGRRSLALALSFRAPERTLTDEDIAPRARADRRRARGDRRRAAWLATPHPSRARAGRRA